MIAEAPGHSRSTPLEADPGRLQGPITVTLPKTTQTSGRVLDPDGKPIAGAAVGVLGAKGGAPYYTRTMTSAMGEFVLVHPPAPFALRATH